MNRIFKNEEVNNYGICSGWIVCETDKIDEEGKKKFEELLPTLEKYCNRDKSTLDILMPYFKGRCEESELSIEDEKLYENSIEISKLDKDFFQKNKKVLVFFRKMHKVENINACTIPASVMVHYITDDIRMKIYAIEEQEN